MRGATAALYRDLALGRRRLIGWGATGDARYALAQFPVLPQCIIDTDRAKWGASILGVDVVGPDRLKTEDADHTAVVVFPRAPAAFEAIRAQILELGRFPVLPAFRIECDGPALATGLAGVDTPMAMTLRALVQPVETGLENALATVAPPRRGRDGHVVLVSELLTLGGSETQICRLAAGLAQAGWQTTLAVFGPRHPHTEGLEDRLRQASVTLDRLSQPREDWTGAGRCAEGGLAAVLRLVPMELAHAITTLYNRLRHDPPQHIVAYMERAGVVAGLAAVLAGVPHVLISLRSLDPGHFSQYFPNGTNWFADCLRLLSSWPGVRFAANSQAGADACARWMGILPERMSVIANAVPDGAERAVARAEALAIRKRLGVVSGQPLIAGVFRLVEEKRPNLFLRTLALLRLRHPDVAAVIVGDGSMRAGLEALGRELGLANCLRFVGGCPDALPYMAAADLLLHTAAFEGLPNVHLEAQSLGRPVASFAVGGVLEALAPDLHPFTAPGGDVETLSDHVLTLMRDHALRDRLGHIAEAWVDAHFGLPRLVVETVGPYLLGDPVATVLPFSNAMPIGSGRHEQY